MWIAEQVKPKIGKRQRRQVQRSIDYAELEVSRYIASNDLAPGAMLPGFSELGKQIGVGAATVQRAVGRLVESGVLRSQPSRGTFVNKSLQRVPAHSPSEPISVPAQRGGLDHTARTRNLTIAMISYLPPEAGGFKWEDAYWPFLMVSSVERTVSHEIGVTLNFINLAEPDGTTLTSTEAERRLLDCRADGAIVYAMGGLEEIDRVVGIASRVGVPIVAVTNQVTLRPTPFVYFDILQSGYVAAKHLIDQGYRRLLYAAPFSDTWVIQRLEGVRQALLDSASHFDLQILIDDTQQPSMSGQTRQSQMAANTWLTGLDRGSAIIGANDNVAHGVLDAANEIGWVAGRDYGILGFDDLRASRERGLTSVHPPIERMGQEAVRLLLQIVRGDTGIAHHVRIPPYLVPRASTSAPALQ